MDWSHILTGLLSAGTVTAIFAGVIAWMNARHKNKRENRGDEIDVLHTSIRELRKDNAALRADLEQSRGEILTLKDEHTACLVIQEGLRQEASHLQHLNGILEARVLRLETTVARLSGGQDDG